MHKVLHRMALRFYFRVLSKKGNCVLPQTLSGALPPPAPQGSGFSHIRRQTEAQGV